MRGGCGGAPGPEQPARTTCGAGRAKDGAVHRPFLRLSAQPELGRLCEESGLLTGFRIVTVFFKTLLTLWFQ